MKKYILIFILFILITFYSCNTNYKIKRYIESNCDFDKSDVCYINLKKALKTDYDTMYIFGGTTSAEEVSKIINLKYTNNNWNDDSWKIVLVKNREIVYEDEYYSRNISFFQYEDYRYAGCIGYDLYTDSMFYVKKLKKASGAYFYRLSVESLE
ncbi:MAG: hypothetical protein LBM25_00765 [Bacteroidales bacterium]|jgi:hypothetical protein|nr:hypothetical protein [Bacteroidales bacterium]